MKMFRSVLAFAALAVVAIAPAAAVARPAPPGLMATQTPVQTADALIEQLDILSVIVADDTSATRAGRATASQGGVTYFGSNDTLTAGRDARYRLHVDPGRSA